MALPNDLLQVFAAEAFALFDQVAIPAPPGGPVTPEGVANLYVRPSIFGKAFADKSIPAKDVAVLAAKQRPLATGAVTGQIEAAADATS